MKAKVEDRHKRHLQVLELHELKLDRNGIAEVLGLHPSTVSWHIRREQVRQDRLAELRGEKNEKS
jgi:IS30 family transposase